MFLIDLKCDNCVKYYVDVDKKWFESNKENSICDNCGGILETVTWKQNAQTWKWNDKT